MFILYLKKKRYKNSKEATYRSFVIIFFKGASMKTKSIFSSIGKLSILCLSLLVSVCCSNNSSGSNGTLRLDISGLESLGDNYQYEGWIIVDGKAKTTGVFSVDSTGNLSQTDFPVNQTDLSSASKFVLTIEPNPDSDPDPSSVHILAGSFSSKSASLSVGDSSAIGNDFSSISGKFILATPSDDSTNISNDNEGLWWLDPNTGPGAGLSLPTLPTGWIYEGWIVGSNGPQSTGTFSSVTGADSDGAGSTGGSDAAPAFPGQDIIGTSLNDGQHTAVISIEPVPDNSSSPFLLKPLVKAIDSGAATKPTLIEMQSNVTASFPTGTATIP